MTAWGRADGHRRTCRPKPDQRSGRRVCSIHKCPRACTHTGFANGLAMTSGCEWHMRLWVKWGRS